jgi:hypothetical protein
VRAAAGRLCFFHDITYPSEFVLPLADCRPETTYQCLRGRFQSLLRGRQGTPYKWVDLAKLCAAVLPGINTHRIRYFTALVKPTESDPDIRQRQEAYIRALETIQNLTVHYGHYLRSTVSMRLAFPLPGGSSFADVLKMEERVPT